MVWEVSVRFPYETTMPKKNLTFSQKKYLNFFGIIMNINFPL